MGASSTEGTGRGAAFPGQTGPGNNRNIFLSKNSPHLVATAFVDGPGGIASGVVNVTFIEPLEGTGSSYELVLHRELGSGTEILVIANADKTDDANGDFASFEAAIPGNTDYRMFIYRNLPQLADPTVVLIP